MCVRLRIVSNTCLYKATPLVKINAYVLERPPVDTRIEKVSTDVGGRVLPTNLKAQGFFLPLTRKSPPWRPLSCWPVAVVRFSTCCCVCDRTSLSLRLLDVHKVSRGLSQHLQPSLSPYNVHKTHENITSPSANRLGEERGKKRLFCPSVLHDCSSAPFQHSPRNQQEGN